MLGLSRSRQMNWQSGPFQAHGFRFTCVSHSTRLMRESGVLLQVSCQSSSYSRSILIKGVVRASCMDNSTACLEVILEPSPLEILLQLASSHASPSSSPKQSSQPLQSTRDILDAASACLLSSLPQQPGLSVLIRCIALSVCSGQLVLCMALSGLDAQQSFRPLFWHSR